MPTRGIRGSDCCVAILSEFGQLEALFFLNLGVEDGFAACNGGFRQLVRLAEGPGSLLRLIFRELEAREDEFQTGDAG